MSPTLGLHFCSYMVWQFCLGVVLLPPFTQSTAYFTQTFYVPTLVPGVGARESPCTIDKCAQYDWCHYWSPESGTYCFYGGAPNVTENTSMPGYVKTNLNYCPSTNLTEPEVAALFTSPCAYRMGSLDTVASTAFSWPFLFTNYTYTCSGSGGTCHADVVQQFNASQSDYTSCFQSRPDGCTNWKLMNGTTSLKNITAPYAFYVGSNYLVLGDKSIVFTTYNC